LGSPYRLCFRDGLREVSKEPPRRSRPKGSWVIILGEYQGTKVVASGPRARSCTEPLAGLLSTTQFEAHANPLS